MDGDPAIRWQVLRDLLAAPEDRWRDEQVRVATEGWGARLLTDQDGDGRWTPRLYGKKWISTTYSMVLLRRLGLAPREPRALRACQLFLDEGLRPDGGIDLSVSTGRSETCLTGMVLGLLSWFGCVDSSEALVEYLLDEQMPDGGWNCRRDRGATHSSFHTTTNVLEGLREYATADGPQASQARSAEAGGRELLLEHHLYRSHRSGEVVDPKMLRLSFPPRWRHDILRSLDYFRSADSPDQRLSDPISVLVSKRRRDGRWLLQQRHPGQTWFEMEEVGRPSRWNTLRCLRVLDWWEASELAT